MIVLAWILHSVDPSEIAGHLSAVDPVYALLLLAAAAVQNLVMQPGKIWLILWIDAIRLSYYECLLLRMTGMALKFVIPFKIGEGAKVVFLKRVYDYDVARGIGVIVFDKVTATAGFLSLIFAGCLIEPTLRAFALPIGLAAAGSASLVTTPAAGLIVRYFPFLPRRVRDVLDNMAHIFHRVPLRLRLVVLGYSIVQVAYDLVFYVLAFAALGIDIPFSLVLVCVPIVYFAVSLPVLMNGIGIREGAVMVLLAAYATGEQLFAAGALISFFEIVVFSVIGALFLPSLFSRIGAGNGKAPATADRSATDDRRDVR